MFSSSSLGCSSKKKRTSSNGRFARCQFLVRLIILELEENCSWKKKGKIFTQNVTLFLKNARARASTHIHRSRQNEWEYGRRERQFCR